MKRAANVLACILLGSLLQADSDSLRNSSPFIPSGRPAHNATSAIGTHTQSPTSVPFLFKGIVNLANTYHFSILDQKTQRSRWLNLGQEFNELNLLGYDEASKHLLVEYQDKAIRLPLSLENNISVAIKASPSIESFSPNQSREIVIESEPLPNQRAINPRMALANTATTFSSQIRNHYRTNSSKSSRLGQTQQANQIDSDTNREESAIAGLETDVDPIQGIITPPTDPNPRILSANELKNI